jgi:transposase-like protein
MENLKEALDILKRLSEEHVEEALTVLREIKERSDKEKKADIPECPHCGSSNVVRNGHRRGKQAYVCRGCKKSFVRTTKSAFMNSHFGEAVWRQVIRDTVNGVSIDETANNLDIHHETAFNMRHKVLYCLEHEELQNPTMLGGFCELDETYLLESYKGSKLPENFWRKSRKHGAKAQQPGLSNEYICVCAGVSREGAVVSRTVNRATAGSADIESVFGNRIRGKTVLLTDEAKGYKVLNNGSTCGVLPINKENTDEFFNINTVNNFHSSLKERYRAARGFATKYINRYNALFAKSFKASTDIVDHIYDLMFDKKDRYRTIEYTQNSELLEI